MTAFFQKKLFKDISVDEYKQLLSCLGARTRTYQMGETVCSYRTGFHDIGILGSGSASLVRFEYNGARTILERLSPQDIFGSMLCCCSNDQTGASVICDTQCQVLFLQYDKISASCSKACAHHHQLTQNLFDLISERALNLSRRVEVLSQRTIRDKLMCYFSQLATQYKTSAFQLPFTMVDLADYLSIDRSAMTRELKKMKNDGIISLERHDVRLLQ